MSVTALVWLLLYCIAVLGSFVNPVLGALGYLLEYYMRPELKWWGDELPALRWNLIVSLALAVSLILKRGSLREMAPAVNAPLRWLLALNAVMIVVTLSVSVRTDVSWDWTQQWMKMAVIFPLLLAAVVRSRGAFDAFTAVNMMGATWWGYQAWIDPKRDAGRLMNIGSGDSLNDNAAAAHLLTVLPFVLVLLLTEKHDKRLRALTLLAAPFVINTLILCNSRGATVGLLAATLAAVVLVRSQYRLRLVISAVTFGFAFIMMADPQFISRQQSTTDYENDGSSQQRLETWQGAYRLVLDRPFGAGGRGFHLLSPHYIPDIVAMHGGAPRAPHNTWAQVAAEWGILGLVCFGGLFLSALLMLRRVKRQAAIEERGYFYWRAVALQLGIIAHLVSGAFTDRFYGEAGYWLVALAFALYRIQLTEQAEGTPLRSEIQRRVAA